MEDDSFERWLPVIGFEGRYEVSDQGRVRSLARPGRRSTRILKPRGRGNPYGAVLLSAPGLARPVDWLIHLLVLEVFVGPRPEGAQARHLNGDALDNRAVNLAWGTPKENAADKRVHGTVSSKLTEAQVREIRASSASCRSLAAVYGVSHGCINFARTGRNWSHVEAA